MATLVGTVPFPKYEKNIDFKTYIDRSNKALDKLINISTKVPEDIIKDRVIYFPVADGQAFYLVTKEKPVQLKFIPYLDGYQVSHIMIRGLRKQDILQMRR